jgi:DNA-directed RNA polymerase specialized sigma24 family protein
MAGWIAVCIVHGLALIDACPECRIRLELPSLSRYSAFRVSSCRNCSCPLDKVTNRAAHPLAIEHQRRLLAARVTGFFELPDGRVLDWPTALKFSSTLLAVAWAGSTAKRQRRLIERVSDSLGGRFLSGRSVDNYDGLLVLAWLLNSWPLNLHRLISVDSPTLAELTAELSQLADASSWQMIIEEILGPVWPSRAPTALTSAEPRPIPPLSRNHLPTKKSGGLNIDYKDLRKSLIDHLRKSGVARHDAHDLAQEALLRVLEYDQPIRNVWALAFSIVNNLMIDQVRRRHVRDDCKTTLVALYGGSQESRDGFRIVAGRQLMGRMIDCLYRMSERRRDAWVSARISGDPIRVIAYTSGVTLTAVDDILRRADQEIAEVLTRGRGSLLIKSVSSSRHQSRDFGLQSR